MNIEVCTFFVLVVVMVCAEHINELPSYFPRCYRTDPNLNNCLLKATETMRPYLKKGIPELQIPSISPFFVPEVAIEEGSGALNYKNLLQNLEITGLDTYKFQRFDYNPEKMEFYGALDMGRIKFKGDYTLGGKILTLPVEGNGTLIADILNSNGTLQQTVKIINKNGVEYLAPVFTKVKINVGEALPPKLVGLFDRNEVLANATTMVIREHLRELIEEAKPAVEQVMTKIIENVLLKSIFMIPYDVIYPLKE